MVKKDDAGMEAILRPRGHNVTYRAVFFKLIQNVFLFLRSLFSVFLKQRTLHTVKASLAFPC